MLENKIHTTVLEVDLDRMQHNLNYFRGLLRPGERMMAMVKAAGYGSGTFEVANLLERQGVDFLAVAFARPRASRCARRASRCRSSC